MKILEKLIVITLIIYPFGELARFNIFKDTVLHPIDVGVFLILIAWLIIKLKNKVNIFRVKNFIPFALFVVIALMSLIANSVWLKQNEILVSFLYLVRWVAYTSVYFAVRDTSQDFLKRVLPSILFYVGLLITVLGFLQLIFFPSLMSMHIYQWDKHMYRLFSVFLDPNYTGAFLVLYLIFVLTKTLDNLRLRKKRGVYINFAISFFVLVAIFLTFSRSALLMLLFSGFTFLIIIKRIKLIVYLLIAVVLFVIVASPLFYIENLNLFRVNSSMERIDSAKIALQIIEKNPLIGIGFNSYRYAQVKYGFRTPVTKYSSHADAGTDNSFLFIAATTGIIGLIFYLLFWLAVLKDNFRSLNKENRIYKAGVIAMIAGLMVSGQFNNSLFYGPLLIWLWMVVGTIDSRKL